MAQNQWKPPNYAIPDSDWKPPSYAVASQEESTEPSKPGIASKIIDQQAKPKTQPPTNPSIYDKLTTPLIDAPSRFASSIANYIDDPQGEGGYLRGLAAGSIQGLGDVISGLTSPLDLAATATGLGSVSLARRGLRGAEALRRTTQALSIPVAAHGASVVADSDRPLSERALGLAELAGGAAGIHFPKPSTIPRPVKGLLEAAPEIEPEVPRALPSGKFFVSPRGATGNAVYKYDRGVIRETPSMLESLGGEIPRERQLKISLDEGEALPDIITKPTKIEDVTPTPKVEAETPSFLKATSEHFKNLAKDEKGEVDIEKLREAIRRSEEDEDLVKSIIQMGGNPMDIRSRPPENIAMVGTAIESTGPDWMTAIKNLEESKDIPELPQAARAAGGKVKIGADVESLGKVLGSSLYQGDIRTIATKELLQNSLDAIRPLGAEGKINVEFNSQDNSLQVSDNGKGLTRREIETIFTDLGSSGKRSDTSAIGGFGLAKAAPLLGGERVEVSTVSMSQGKKIKVSFSGTPDELLRGVDINEEIVPSSTPTGTNVKVFVPEEGSFYDAKRFVRNLSGRSKALQGKINMGERWSANIDPEIQEFSSSKLAEPLVELDNPYAKTSLIIPKDSEVSTRSWVQLQLSNNGMWQGEKTFYLPYDVPNIPKDIIVDIQSKVPEGHKDYPFTANREELRGNVKEQVEEYIKENLVKPAFNRRIDELTRLYNTMPKGTTVSGRDFFYYDPKGQLDGIELAGIRMNPSMNQIADVVASTIDDVLLIMDRPGWIERLERVGFIFDDGFYGIHIPNPKTKKSAILVNPFLHFKGTPDEAASGILHTILHETAHIEPTSPGHNEAFTIRLGDIYGRFGAQRSIDIQNKILDAISEPNGDYRSEIQDLLQRYTESRGREATTEDLLTGTGTKQAVKPGGEGDIPIGSRPGGKGTLIEQGIRASLKLGESASSIKAKFGHWMSEQEMINAIDRILKEDSGEFAADKLLQAIKAAIPKRAEQEAIYSEGRRQRIREFAKSKVTSAKGAKIALGKLRGEYEKVEVSPMGLSEKEVGQLFSAIKTSPRITEFEKATSFQAMFKLLEGGPVPQSNELNLLGRVFGHEFADQIVELHGGLGGVNIKLAKTANTMKALMSSHDLSAPLRQGWPMALNKEYYKAFASMFEYAASPKRFEMAMKEIESRPNFLSGRKAGLYIADVGSLLAGEEAFLNSYLHDLSTKGRTGHVLTTSVRASERGYVGFLNKLRADMWDSMLRDGRIALGRKLNENEAKAIAKFINVMTGRGSIGSLERNATLMNTLFFSPRLIASRIQSFNPKIYMDLPKGTRKYAIKSLFSIAAMGSIVSASLASAFGGKVSTDATSADFMKARFGEQVLDPHAGYQQYIVAANRFTQALAGINYNNASGNYRPTPWSVSEDFAINKLSPAANLAAEIFRSTVDERTGQRENRFDEPMSIPREIRDRFIPIFIQDLNELASEDVEFQKMIGIGVPTFFGMGSNTYPESNNDRRRSRFRRSVAR